MSTSVFQGLFSILLLKYLAGAAEVKWSEGVSRILVQFGFWGNLLAWEGMVSIIKMSFLFNVFVT